ncbi:HAMP domain-containing protein [Deltaproteobacteria bacterium TL4]
MNQLKNSSLAQTPGWKISHKLMGVFFVVLSAYALIFSLVVWQWGSNNLTSTKFAQLNSITERFADDLMTRYRLLVREIQNLMLLPNLTDYIGENTVFSPYYFLNQKENVSMIGRAEQIEALRSHLHILQHFLQFQKAHNLAQVSYYLLSPHDIVPSAKPTLLFRINSQGTWIVRYTQKGKVTNPIIYYADHNAIELQNQSFFEEVRLNETTTDQAYESNGFHQSQTKPEPSLFLEIETDNALIHTKILEGKHEVIIQLRMRLNAKVRDIESGEDRTTPVAMVVVDFMLDDTFLSKAKEKLNFDTGLALNQSLLLSTLQHGNPVELVHPKRTHLNGNDYYYTQQNISFHESDKSVLAVVVLSPTQELIGLILYLLLKILLISLLGTIVVMFVIFAFTREVIIQPIVFLQNSANQLAEGNLDHAIDTSRPDELGNLARSFATMRDAIRHKIVDLHISNEALNWAKKRLEVLLVATEKIASSRDKFSVMITASNIILKQTLISRAVDIFIAFQEKTASGKVGYAIFQMNIAHPEEGVPSIQTDNVSNVVHSFSFQLPKNIEEKTGTLPTTGCLITPHSLDVCIWHNDQIIGFIQIKGLDQTTFRVEDKEFIDTLSQSLAISLEEISFTFELENKILERTQQLKSSMQKLEQQNTTLAASNRKLEDLNATKEQLLQKVSVLQNTHLSALNKLLAILLKNSDKGTKTIIRQASREIHQIDEMLRPMTSLLRSEQAIQNKRVLLAETDKKQQIIAKMALGGTGVTLDIATDLEEGKNLLSQNQYDILCINSELIELTEIALEKSPNVRSVFMTSKSPRDYLPLWRKHPVLSNIVSRDEEDRSFTLKNIITTVSKLISDDLFGLEKYLNWGVDVTQHVIADSESRNGLISQLEIDLEALGIRRPLISRCAMVAEELLMNAIYDAPMDADGNSLYNHLPRTVPVYLKKTEQGRMCYACDGLFLAISVIDPFGALDRDTILNYLESCYEGRHGSLNKNKGGAGRGLFQIMETVDLMVINVKPKIKTEVIAILNINPNKSKAIKTTSLHYFFD